MAADANRPAAGACDTTPARKAVLRMGSGPVPGRPACVIYCTGSDLLRGYRGSSQRDLVSNALQT